MTGNHAEASDDGSGAVDDAAGAVDGGTAAANADDVDDVTDLYTEYADERLPPGQRRTDRFPVLSKSGTPSSDPSTYDLEVWGAVENSLSYSLAAFRDLPSVTQRQDFHCVTGWSKFDCRFTGVPFSEIVERADVDDDAEHVVFHARDGYTTDLPLADCTRDEVLFAYAYDGDDLPADHGGPLRVVTPHKYAYKGAKWVSGVEFLTHTELGYWEKRGYSDAANPWNEERYS
ncbi:sulfite oxidase-like oxidoreductase [Halorubrum sp. DTA98]|uniref:sulfite oxidase-like oxidoreductase n=1 Tax=Halorubrum sp. DTA98 TaxID=3402163 RepID=UPI003AAC6B86